MTHGSLFSGIGGFDLAAEWMGWQNIFHCEWAEFQRKILDYYFPKAISYHDIRKTDFRKHRGQIDVLSGGFPCQPFSVAGKRRGAEDDRYLWDEMLRAIREIRPTWIVGENVTGLLSMVQPGETIRVENQTNLFHEDCKKIETIESEFVLKTIRRDLRKEGYSVQPILIPACAVQAPHRRDRVWIIARRTDSRAEGVQLGWQDGVCGFGSSTNTDSSIVKRQYKYRSRENELDGRDCQEVQTRWENFPTQSPICSGDDGLSARLDGITFPQLRRKSIEGYGNAIVPQLAYRIFKAIEYASGK